MTLVRQAALCLYPIVALILFIPTFIYRWIIFHLASLPSFRRLFRPKLGKMLTAFSTSHVLVKESNSYVIPICIKGELRKEKVVERLREVMGIKDAEGRLLYPELRQTVISFLGFLFWEDLEKFSLEDKVVVLDSAMGVEDSIIKLNSRTVKIGQEPLWEIGLIHKVEENETWVLFRFHHALCDGLAFVNFLDNMTSPKFQKDWDKKLEQKRIKVSLLQYCSLVRAPLDILRHLAAVLQTGLFQEHGRVPTGDLCYRTLELPLRSIKDVSKAFEVPFTSVAVAMFASGLRKLAEKRMEIPRKKLLFIPIPWVGRGEKLRNWGSMVQVILPLDEISPLKRLQNINDQLKSMKASSLPLVSFFFSRVSGVIFPALQKKVISVGIKGNVLVFTPFLVSREKVNAFEVEMTALKGSCLPMEGTRGIMCTSQGYGDKAYISVSADKGILSQDDADIFLESWNDELILLNQLEGVQTKTV